MDCVVFILIIRYDFIHGLTPDFKINELTKIRYTFYFTAYNRSAEQYMFINGVACHRDRLAVDRYPRIVFIKTPVIITDESGVVRFGDS